MGLNSKSPCCARDVLWLWWWLGPPATKMKGSDSTTISIIFLERRAAIVYIELYVRRAARVTAASGHGGHGLRGRATRATTASGHGHAGGHRLCGKVVHAVANRDRVVHAVAHRGRIVHAGGPVSQYGSQLHQCERHLQSFTAFARKNTPLKRNYPQTRMRGCTRGIML